MRIISGKFRGRKFIYSKKLNIRPTTGLAREGLFNILQNKFHFDSIQVADLCSGSGAIGFEFISRGAIVTFLDKNPKCIIHLKNTAKIFNVKPKIIKKDVFNFIKDDNEKFNLIFADPPYSFSKTQYNELIYGLSNKLFDKNSILVLEHYKKNIFNNFEIYCYMKEYGDSYFSFFKTKSG